jgi:hypothetical protein
MTQDPVAMVEIEPQVPPKNRGALFDPSISAIQMLTTAINRETRGPT